MIASLPPRILRAGALYDLVVTAPFATPWTARLVLGALAALPLGGTALPAFDEGQLLFVTLFGTLVTLWSLFRIARPSLDVLRVDTLGRALFALWMARALAVGAPRVVLLFCALELTFFALQSLAITRWRASVSEGA